MLILVYIEEICISLDMLILIIDGEFVTGFCFMVSMVLFLWENMIECIGVKVKDLNYEYFFDCVMLDKIIVLFIFIDEEKRLSEEIMNWASGEG